MKVLYFCHYFTDRQRLERGFTARNTAGVNRMRRIAGALKAAGIELHLASPAITARCRPTRLLHPSFTENADGLSVTALPAVGIPFLSVLCEPFLGSLWFLVNAWKSRPTALLVFDFPPSFVAIAAIARLMGIRVVEQIEDVSVPKVRDWSRASETRPVQQLVAFFCMKALIWLSTECLVPTSRFKQLIPPSKRSIVITGCVENTELSPAGQWPNEFSPNNPLKILFLGKYEVEHGLALMTRTITLLRAGTDGSNRLAFYFCGTGNFPQECRALAKQDGHPVVNLCGFLSRQQYESLLKEVHVALVLQRSDGRHRDYKTPSKGYELLASGRLLIVTDVGDFATLAPDSALLLKSETPETLAALLLEIADQPAKHAEIAQNGARLAAKEFAAESVGVRLRDLFVAS